MIIVLLLHPQRLPLHIRGSRKDRLGRKDIFFILFKIGWKRALVGRILSSLRLKRENRIEDKMDSPISPASGKSPAAKSPINQMLGLLRVRIKRGVNLAVRDVVTSDPYVVVKMGKQKLKTRVIKKDINPVWNEDLTLSVADLNTPIKLTVYDHDTFSMDDKMGDAEFDIKPFMEALRIKLDGLPSGTVITRDQPCRSNCLSEETCVIWKDGKVIQDMILRLRNVESGEVELQLQWIDLPGAKGF